jgi:hypothetical protein
MTKPTNGFAELSDANLEAKAQFIITKMTDNANFPTPSPTLLEMNGTLSAFTAAATAANTGDKVSILDRDQKKETLVDLLHELSLYVMFIAKGDKVILASSGFNLSKDREPAPPITKPSNLVISTDGLNAGEAMVKFKRVKQSRSYLYEYTSDVQLSESAWSSLNDTRSKLLIGGLESSKRYWFRITALGTGNQAITSDVVSKVIQ